MFLLIERGVEHKDMCVEMRIWGSFHRPAREVNKLRPGEITRLAIKVRSVDAHAGLGFELDILHRLMDGFTERLEDSFVAGDGMKKRNRFGDREAEVVTDPTDDFGTGGQGFASGWMEVVAERVERVFVDMPAQPQELSTLTTPMADDLLSIDIIILPRESLGKVGFRGPGRS